jgi:hypothetical protein
MELKEALKHAGYIKPPWSKSKIYAEVFEIKSSNDEEWREFDYIRGVLTYDGHLYVSDGEQLIHEDLLTAIDIYFKGWETSAESLDKYLCLYSEWNYIFTEAESYDEGMAELIEEDYLEHYNELIKKINPKFKIELEKDYIPK